MSISRLSLLAALAASGCGSVAYDDGSTPDEAQVRAAPVSAGGAAYVVRATPGPPVPGPYVTVIPAPAIPAPAPPAVVAPPPAYAAAARQCSGNERLRIADEVVDGRGGAGVVASGNCVVEIHEAIIRGEPALVVSGNARVDVVESRVQGEIRRSGHAQLFMRGSTHERPTTR